MARVVKDSGVKWIGDIPEDWDVSRLKYVCEINTEFVDPRSGEYDELPHIGPGNIEKYTGRLIEYKQVKDEGLISGKYHFYPHEIVYGKINPQLGKVSFPQFEGLCSADTYAIHAFEHKMLTKYLFFYMLTRPFIDATILESLRMGMPKINSNDLMKLSILVPSISEQQKIVDFLEKKNAEIDRVILATEKTIEEYKALKQSIITEAVTHGVRGERPMKDSGIEWIGEIPRDWSREKVFRLFRVIGSGTTPKSDREDYYSDGTVCWIQSGDINGSTLSKCKVKITEKALQRFSALKIYRAPFVIMAMYGASIGNLAISEIDGCVNQACCVMQDGTQDYKYSFYALKTAKDYLTWKAEGGGQPNISQETIKRLWLPLSPITEQHEIATYLDSKCSDIDHLIEVKQQLLSELEAYKKSVIYEYVTGKKEV